jgi:hypothetical protein
MASAGADIEVWVGWTKLYRTHNSFLQDSLRPAPHEACRKNLLSLGVLNVQSVMPYTGFDQESYIERIKKASFQDRK